MRSVIWVAFMSMVSHQCGLYEAGFSSGGSYEGGLSSGWFVSGFFLTKASLI